MDHKPAAARDAYQEARRVWPNIEVSLESFCSQVARLAIPDDRLSLRAADLYLVAGVLDGVSVAMEHFDGYVTKAAQIAKRLERSNSMIEEVTQALRVKLLAGAAPKLQTYSAKGALIDWLRISAWRIALDLKREHDTPTEQLPLEALIGPDDDVMKTVYLRDFTDALEASFRALTPRERTLLRLYFLDGMNIDRIGVMYGVHRATVARWLVTIRRQLLERAKMELSGRHNLDTREIKSLYRLLQHDVDLTISRILRD